MIVEKLTYIFIAIGFGYFLKNDDFDFYTPKELTYFVGIEKNLSKKG